MWGDDESCMNVGEWHCKQRLLGESALDGNGFQATYKGLCMDIDGFNQGEDPFGYGIRYNGKIIFGLRASEWFKRTIQNKD